MTKILMTNVSDDFVLPDNCYVVVPDESFPESVWFIKAKDSFESAVEMIDDYKNVIAPGLSY